MGTGTAAVTPGAEPDLFDDNGQPVGGEPALVDDNGHPLGQSPLDDPNSVASRAAVSLRNNRLAAMLPPPPPPDDSFFGGMLKGAQSTGTSVLKLAKGAVHGDFAPYDEPAFQDEYSAMQTPHGTAGNVGYFGEKMAELLAPAGLASRGAKAAGAGIDLVDTTGMLARGVGGARAPGTVLAEIPAVTGRLGRAALAGGAEGISNAAVTGLQTGDPHAAAWAGALGAMTAVPLKYWSKTERVQALIRGVVDPALAKPAAEAGTFIQRALADTRDAAGQALGGEYEKVAGAATGRVSIRSTLPGVQEVLSELEDPTRVFPALGASDDVNRAITLLRGFSMPRDAAGRLLPRSVSVEDAIKVRSLLYKLSNSGDVGIGKGALQQLTKAWHSEIVETLSKQSPELAQQFTRASAQYRQFITTFNSQTIKALIKKGAPERVLDVLMSGGGETTATNLRQMIGAQNMEVVRSSLWQRLLEKSSPGDSTFLAPKFNGMLDKLGPEAQAAVFGSTENVVKMRKFAAMMDTSWVHAASKQSLSGLAVKAGAGAAMGMGADRVLEHDGAGGWKVWGPAGAGMALAPALVAKVLAKPGTIDVLARAMATSPAGAVGRALASKVSSLVMGVEMQNGGGAQGGSGGSSGGGGGVDAKGVLGTLEAGDKARRGRAGAASALVTGPPPPPGGGVGGAYLRTGNPAVEFPKNAFYDENDAMFMRRYGANGEDELEFPVPIPPSRLLPQRFKNARQITWGAPLSGVFPERPSALGRYGQDFNHPEADLGPGEYANTAQVSKLGTEEPATYAHELNHAVWEKDLTPAERRKFTATASATWEKLRAAFLSDYEKGAGVSTAQDAAEAHVPKAVSVYVHGPNDALGMHEAFAEMGAQYMLNPTAFKTTYPSWYRMMRQFYGGKEYIQANQARK